MVLLLLVQGGGTAQAASYTWDNGGGDGRWSTLTNWDNGSGNPGVLPGSGDAVIFNGTSTANCRVDTVSIAIASLTTTASYTGAIDCSLDNPSFTISGAVTLHSAVIWTKGTGSLTLAGSGSGTQIINFGEKTIEDLVINDSGATKQLTEGFITDSLTLTAGTLESKMAWADAVTVSGNCALNGGTWTHTFNNTVATYRINVNMGGDLIVGASATINVDSKGFGISGGPGTGTNNNLGGSHGGQGNGVGGVTYGSLTAPVTLGSGAPNAGYGGGAVLLAVTGTSTVDGVISAKGSDSSAAAGAGGSVYLTTGSLAGTGSIVADGGTVTGAGGGKRGGGGGRVAVILTSGSSLASVTMTAYGGDDASSNREGAAGTVYTEIPAQGAGGGNLLIDNRDLDTSRSNLTLIPSGVDLSGLDTITIRNDGILGIGSGVALDFGSVTIAGENRDDAVIVIRNSTGISFPATFTIDGYTLRLDTPVSVADSDWTVAAGGRLDHSPNTTTEVYKLSLTLSGSGDLTVAASGQINVNARGYDKDSGPGVGVYINRAGSHGGRGGDSGSVAAGVTYGSISAPTTCGSGSPNGGAGGGVIFLDIAGTTTVNGVVSANGESNSAGAGAGGSVQILTGALAGSGTISADGGDGVATGGARWAGGGGRVSVILDASDSFGSVAITAYGGNDTTNRYGAAGTVYKQTQTQGANRGSLIIDNRAFVPAGQAVTALDDQGANSTTVGSLTVQNAAKFTIGADDALIVGGNVSVGTGTTLTLTAGGSAALNIAGNLVNSGTFTGGSGSTVTLDGANQSLSGNCTFANLNKTVGAAATLTIQKASVTTVNGTLTLQGASGQLLSLRSSEDDADGDKSDDWDISPLGSRSINYVNVKDSNNISGTAIRVSAAANTNAGENTNWVFSVPPGQVTLLTPVSIPDGGAAGPADDDLVSYGRTLNPKPALIWSIPADADGDSLHFRVYLGSATGPGQVAYSGSSQTGFEYDNGTTWVAFPVGGAAQGANRVRYTPQVALAANDDHFWTVCATDSLDDGTVAVERRFIVATRAWTDDTITANVTPIRKAHLDELRQEANYAQAFRNITPTNFGSITANQTQIHVGHFTALRSAMDSLKALTSNTSITWTDSLIPNSTRIRAIHLNELRTAVGGL